MTPVRARSLSPEQLRAWTERRRSNAAGVHRDRRSRRQTRKTQRETAITESRGE